MLSMLRRNWWISALRGIAAIVLGVAVWDWPDQPLFPLIVLFGIFTFIR